MTEDAVIERLTAERDALRDLIECMGEPTLRADGTAYGDTLGCGCCVENFALTPLQIQAYFGRADDVS